MPVCTYIAGTPVKEEHYVVLQFELQVEGSLPLRLKLQVLTGLTLHRIHTLWARDSLGNTGTLGAYNSIKNYQGQLAQLTVCWTANPRITCLMFTFRPSNILRGDCLYSISSPILPYLIFKYGRCQTEASSPRKAKIRPSLKNCLFSIT